MTILDCNNSPKEVNTVFFWENHKPVTLPASKLTLEGFLSFVNKCSAPMHLVITTGGKLYATEMTPGYCDGEVTTTKNRIIEAANNLPRLQ